MAMPVGNDKANNKDDASDRVWRWDLFSPPKSLQIVACTAGGKLPFQLSLTGNAAELRHGSFGVLSSMSTAGTDPFNRRHSLLHVAVDYFSKPLTMACYHCAVPLYCASRAFTVGGDFRRKSCLRHSNSRAP